METKVSTKGQVALPGSVRRELDLRAGDPLDVMVENGRNILTPSRTRSQEINVLLDPITGLPVLAARPNAPPMSSKQVREIFSSGKE